jgi:uncharacterized protein
MSTIIHFEIPADDLERSKKFYSGMFGRKFEKFTLADGMDYLIITTTDEQENKAIGGGMMKRQNPQHVMTNYNGVKSVDEYSANISIRRKGSYVKKNRSRNAFFCYMS